MSNEDTDSKSSTLPNASNRGLETTGNTLRELTGLAATPTPNDSDDLCGSVFGRFRILSILGRGGMGVVYLAEDAALARQVALKVLSLEVAEDPEHRQRLLREARASAALSHPNIAVIHEMGEIDGRLYIAMERIIGESLRQRIDKGSLSPNDAVAIAKQILLGVAKAHDAGIVHRDLKPDNIMVSTDGIVKVLDFGIAKFLVDRRDTVGTSITATEHGRLLGTPSYMSPEQANAAPIDARSDVFSFGILLYEMLVGKTPFTGKTFLDVLASLARDEPRRPSELNPRINKDIEAVVLRCLRKEPNDRYANAAAVLDALSTCSDNDVSDARKNRPTADHRRLYPGLALGAIALTAAAIFGLKSPRPDSSDKPIVSSNIAPVTAPSGSTGPVPTLITGHPPPKSSNETALAAYREGLQALRDGAYVVADNAFARAVELDPELGAAYVRRVITGIWHAPTPEDVRRTYRKAISHRDQLAERDKLLLEALEPIIQREPPNPEEAAKRLKRASERFPGDAELLATRSLAPFAPNLSPTDELALSDQCLALDPGYADCSQPRASALFRLGRLEETTAETNHCLEVSPAANDCIADRMEMHALFGRCAAMAEDAQRIIANDTTDWSTHRALATALLAQGRAISAVRAALAHGWDKAPAAQKRRWERFDDIHFALLEGRFEDAERAFVAWKAQEEKNPFDDVHLQLARDMVELYDVMGKTQEAAHVAEEYLNTREAWVKGFIRFIWDDPTVWFSKKKRNGGMITAEAYQAERASWVKTWDERIAPDMKNLIWLQAFVLPTETADDAREALTDAPALKPLEYYRKQPTQFHLALGNVYLLAGRVQDALPHLSAAASDCRILYKPIENTIAHFRLAKAHGAAKNDQKACEEYRIVLQRWGHSRSKIPVVDEARRHFKQLACKAPQ